MKNLKNGINRMVGVDINSLIQSKDGIDNAVSFTFSIEGQTHEFRFLEVYDKCATKRLSACR